MKKGSIVFICSIIFCAVVASSDNVLAYNDQTNTVTAGYSTYFGSTGYFSVSHRVGLQSGSQVLNACSGPISFAHAQDAPFFFSGDGAWDSPYGEWRNDYVSSSEVIRKGQYIEGSCAYYKMPLATMQIIQNAGRELPGTLAPIWSLFRSTPFHQMSSLFGSRTYNFCRPGYVYGTATTPSVAMTSNNPSVMQCNGMTCWVVAPGKAVVTANIAPTNVNVWNMIFATRAPNGEFSVTPLTLPGTTLSWAIDIAPCTCTGTLPVGSTMCPQANVGLKTPTAWSSVGIAPASCTNTKKCEYYTIPKVCTNGPLSSDKVLCPNDDKGLILDAPLTYVGESAASCTNLKKCEYYDRTCSQSIPPGSIMCSGDDKGLMTDAAWHNVTECSDAQKCEYTTQATCGSKGENPENVLDPVPQNPGLCGSGCNLSVGEGVTLNKDGYWEWTCNHSSPLAIPSTKSCTATSCLAGEPLHVQSNVFWQNDNTAQASVSVSCQNVCCKFESADVKDDLDEVVCNGDGEKYVNITHSGAYPADCYFTSDPGHVVRKNPNVTTMCVSHSCNAQNLCQAIPQQSNAADGCQSTCSSNADCSSGKMIETRP